MDGPARDTDSPWCVLAHPPGDPPAPELLDEISRRPGLRTVAGAFSAMAKVSILSRTAPTGALILYAPDRLRHARELLQAVEAYTPRVRCWRIDDGIGSLRPVNAADVRHRSPQPRAGENSLMQAPAGPDAPSGAMPEGPSRMDPPSTLLTDEELDLLLARDADAQEDGRTDG